MNTRVILFGVATIITLVVRTPAWGSAPAGRYSVLGGTVYDTKTKLIWQQTASPTMYSWSAAQSLCANVGSVLGGSGWRLPTVKELQTLVDYTNAANFIDPTFFGSTSPQGLFWSSTKTVGASSPSAWFVGFDPEDGFTGSSAQSSSLFVRCVR